MKRVYFIIGVIVLLIISGYLFIRFSVLKTQTVKADNTKAVSVLDLRPAIIAKLKELVKEGSRGLYDLSIERLEPFILQSKLDVYNARLTPDTNILAKLNELRLAPDDVFKISFDSLHIDGIGINDLLHKDKIDIRSIFINNPEIEVFHTEKAL